MVIAPVAKVFNAYFVFCILYTEFDFSAFLLSFIQLNENLLINIFLNKCKYILVLSEKLSFCI